MRSRLVDLALILALVAVGAAILWTLFNLGANQPPVARSTVTDESTGAAPVPPAASAVTTAPRSDPPAEEADEPEQAAEPAATGEPVASEPPSPPEAAPRVLPAGVLALERVGFSYVTGGPGACGVVLEAWTHVAVSRDLLEAYGCGAQVRVTIDEPAGGRSELEGIIGDTMNPSFSRTVNVYVGTDENAFSYGLTTGTFEAR